jgi:subtilisin family serine protease
MKQQSSSESALFTLRAVVACACLCASAMFTYLAVAAPQTADTAGTDWRSKVDAGVYAAAAEGDSEFIIYMAQKADLSGADALGTKEEKGRFVYDQLKAVAAETQPAVIARLRDKAAEYKPYWISNAIWVRGDLAAVEAAASMPEVAAIQPIGQGALQRPAVESVSTEAPQAAEPGLTRVRADAVWTMGYRGHGVVVAGADTGVRFTHNALRTQYRGWGGSAATSTHDYNWHDSIHLPNTACPGDSPQPCDDDAVLGGGHGTHTVGSMIGNDGAGNQIGMAPSAQWIACRNMNNGVGAIPTYLECMQWFLAPTKINSTMPDPTKSPDVINNSWGCVEGCPPEPNPLRDTLQASRAAGIVYVVSAGNDGPSCATIQHPLARYPESFTVGSTTHTTDVISGFSSRGPTAVDPQNPGSPLYRKPNITAPGSTIRSALRASDSTYGNLSGTSMAGPHVAGLVALVISANPALRGNVTRIEQIIQDSAARKTTTEACGMDSNTQVPNNTYGWGRIDALNAVQLALAEATPVPMTAIASRKTHGGSTFDLLLPSSGVAGVESRAAQPAAGEHTIVFTFANPIANVGDVSVSGGTAAVGERAVGSNSREYIVSLSSVANAQRVTVTLHAVTDTSGNSSPSISVPIDFLLGDANADRVVNVADSQQTRARSGQTAGTENFRWDVNLDGTVNSADAIIVRQQSGNAIAE